MLYTKLHLKHIFASVRYNLKSTTFGSKLGELVDCFPKSVDRFPGNELNRAIAISHIIELFCPMKLLTGWVKRSIILSIESAIQKKFVPHIQGLTST